MRELRHDILHEFFHLDGKIWRTVVLLLVRPGFLTQEYFAGRRVRHISPLRLYLTFSVLFFLVAAIIPEASESAALLHWAPRALFLFVPVFAGLVAFASRGSGRNYPEHLYFALHIHAFYFLLDTLSAVSGMAAIPYLSSAVSLGTSLWIFLYLVLAYRRAYEVSFGPALLRMFLAGLAYEALIIGTVKGIAHLTGVALPSE